MENGEGKRAKYITTTLPYVNSDPHIGFAAEIVAADALARYWRILNYDVFFNTGTDEHGQKIAQKADDISKERQAYVDHFAGEFLKLKDLLGLSNDAFIRTTDDGHKKAAQELWKRCAANVDENDESDIYKKKFKGLYCVGDEMFLKESDLINGRCPNHPNMDPIEIEEENYFFRLSRYQKDIEEYLSDEGVIVPEWRRQEAINFVKGGLEDFSISRERSRLDWGVPVPGDDSQVMYVWFDALTNYISTLGWPDDAEGKFKKFWEEGETLQLAGKDQVRFQSIMWQAMLKSAKLPATKQVLYHGFINSGGQKMSKSLGNVIAPTELFARYGTEATRYLLLRHVHPFDDTDITWERLDEWYTANLVNGLGNLTARIMKMAETYIEEGFVSPLTFSEAVRYSGEAFRNVGDEMRLVLNYKNDFEQFQIHDALNFVWFKIQNLDERITKTEPFKLVKENLSEGKATISELVKGLCEIAILLQPLMPNTSKIIIDAIAQNKKPENLFARLQD